jgi:outer membrane protein OmpA-like peptidoglycan-associated protein
LPPAFLSRAVRLAVPLATAFALATPLSARAADGLGAGGVVIPGSALAVGVSGATNQAGKVTARFSGVSTPLFWGSNTTNMNDTTAAVFALNTPSGLYSAQSEVPTDNAPFTQTSAPVQTGTGTVGDPYVVTSHYDATAVIHVTQTITHVSGTTKFTASYSILNNGGPTNMQAFIAADMYVNGNDNGTGTASGSAPNRVIGSVASDDTQAQLIEQAGAPWNHYFSGMNMPYYNATGDSTYGYLPDTIDPTVQDSGMGVEWDITVPANGTRTLSVVWNFTHPAAPQAPRITGGVAAENALTQATTASPAFTYATGDAAHSIAFQCSVDGASFAACSSPGSLTGLTDGTHTFAVRALNSAGDPGPATTRTWTVDTTPPVAPTLTGAPTGTVATDNASITLTGEAGATFKCSVDGGSYVTCASPLVLTGLADGSHTVSVKQLDAANNPSTLVGTAGWTVDTSVPAAPAGLTHPDNSTSTSASLSWTTVNGLGYECNLDGGAYVACSPPLAFTGLNVGQHTVQVRGVSAAGTAGAPSTATWTVAAPPVVEPPVAPTPTPEPPTATPVPPTSTSTPTPTKPTFTGTVGGRQATGNGAQAGAATITVSNRSLDVGCQMTGVELASCKVDLYAGVPARRAAAAARVLVGTGVVEAGGKTNKLSVRVVLNATGRDLLSRSKHGLDVQVAITGKPVSGDAMKATGSARLVAKRSTATVGGFGVGRATLSAAAKRQLTALARKLGSGASVRVTGYTDNSSSDAKYLRELGLARARAVKAFLASRGAKATYTLASRAARNPRATNATERGRALNRRVVLEIVG